MKVVYTIKEDKSNVQDYYVRLILTAFEELGYKSVYLDNIQEAYKLPKKSTIVAISHYTTLKLVMRGFKNIIYWVQGTSPDESFMRNHSRLRWFIISCVEYISLKRAKLILMVSKGMSHFYEDKYHLHLDNKAYIMPCYNSQIRPDVYATQGKYKRNLFCYVGGLSPWQCFEDTVLYYKRLEEMIDNAELRVFTPDVDQANKIISHANLKNASAKYVKPEQLLNELSECKYGFIIRKESPVNFVATPTKLSNYLASGLIPIVSNTVEFFSAVLNKCHYAILLEDNKDITPVVQMSSEAINPNDVFNEYNELFKEYFNDRKHIENIKLLINRLCINYES